MKLKQKNLKSLAKSLRKLNKLATAQLFLDKGEESETSKKVKSFMEEILTEASIRTNSKPFRNALPKKKQRELGILPKVSK